MTKLTNVKDEQIELKQLELKMRGDFGLEIIFKDTS